MRADRILLAGAVALCLTARPSPAEEVVSRPGRYARPHELAGAEGLALVFLGETGPEPLFATGGGHGGGFRIFIGQRPTPLFELELSWQETWHGAGGPALYADGMLLGAVALDFKFHPWRGRVQPYFVVSPTGFFLQTLDWAPQTGGVGFGTGGGVDLFVVPGLSFGARLNYQGALLFDAPADGDRTWMSALAFRLDVVGRFR